VTGANQHRVDRNQKKEITDADGYKSKTLSDYKLLNQAKKLFFLKGEVFFLLDPSFNG